MSATIATRLTKVYACKEAIEWLGRRSSPERAWRACKRGDWLLWLAVRVEVDRRVLVLTACDCAELALVHVPDGEHRPRRAIEVAKAWAGGDGDVSLDDVRRAAAYATYAADAAPYAAAAAASYAARNAANAAAYAAANAASYAAYATASAADATTYAAAERKAQGRKLVSMVRAAR